MNKIAICLFCMAVESCAPPSIPADLSDTDTNERGKERSLRAEMVGEYLCTVSEKASIASIHLEGSGPPEAILGDGLPTKFRVGVSQREHDLKLVELPYNGADRDPVEWHTNSSVLHGTYSGDGETFASDEEGAEAFFVIGPTVHSNGDGDMAFYHSGFEWAGGEDTNLSIRWGRCTKT